jgi:hypothetical protein
MSSDTQEVDASTPEAPATAPAPTKVEMSVAQFQVLLAEMHAIEKHAHRMTVLASDYASALLQKLTKRLRRRT